MSQTIYLIDREEYDKIKQMAQVGDGNWAPFDVNNFIHMGLLYKGIAEGILGVGMRLTESGTTVASQLLHWEGCHTVFVDGAYKVQVTVRDSVKGSPEQEKRQEKHKNHVAHEKGDPLLKILGLVKKVLVELSVFLAVFFISRYALLKISGEYDYYFEAPDVYVEPEFFFVAYPMMISAMVTLIRNHK